MDQVAHISASSLNMNLSVLQRQDPLINAVLGTSSHVTVYVFNNEQKAWSRKDCEGSLFVFQRSQAPFFGFFILNRLSIENILEYVDDGFEVEISEPYMLYRNSKGGINGIWFYVAEERKIISSMLLDIVEKTGNQRMPSQTPQSIPPNQPQTPGMVNSNDPRMLPHTPNQAQQMMGMGSPQMQSGADGGNNNGGGDNIIMKLFQKASERQGGGNGGGNMPPDGGRPPVMNSPHQGVFQQQQPMPQQQQPIPMQQPPQMQQYPSGFGGPGMPPPNVNQDIKSSILGQMGRVTENVGMNQASRGANNDSNALPLLSPHFFAKDTQGAPSVTRTALSRTDFKSRLIQLIESDPKFMEDLYGAYLSHCN